MAAMAVIEDDDDIFLDETAVEPDCAFKLGAFSCFFTCSPRAPQAKGASRSSSANAAAYAAEDGAGGRASGTKQWENGAEVPRRAVSSFSREEAPTEESFVAAPTSEAAALASGVFSPSLATLPSSGSVTRGRSRIAGLLGPVVMHFEASIWPGPTPGEASELLWEEMLSGVEAFSVALNKFGGDMGTYLLANTAKIRKSKTDSAEKGYRQRMLSELPFHGPTFAGYKDPSAWMGNLWLAWTLEFFVEFFAQLHAGKETPAGIDIAYKTTLYNHHNFFERTGFNAGVKRLPSRTELYKLLQGSASPADVNEEMGAFVASGRTVYRFCLETNNTVSAAMNAEKKKPRGR